VVIFYPKLGPYFSVSVIERMLQVQRIIFLFGVAEASFRVYSNGWFVQDSNISFKTNFILRIKLQLSNVKKHNILRFFFSKLNKVLNICEFTNLLGPFLTFCVPCIVTNYVNGPTRCAFYIYIFIYSTDISTLRVSKDLVFHHQDNVERLDRSKHVEWT
jgi:hypothetical protein